jgi:hypothetical protein
VYNKNEVDHYSHLQKVLQLLRHHKMFAKQSKCVFAQNQVEYIGHIMTGQGVATDPEKVRVVQD